MIPLKAIQIEKQFGEPKFVWLESSIYVAVMGVVFVFAVNWTAGYWDLVK